jgi:hypothetical protein
LARDAHASVSQCTGQILGLLRGLGHRPFFA